MIKNLLQTFTGSRSSNGSDFWFSVFCDTKLWDLWVGQKERFYPECLLFFKIAKTFLKNSGNKSHDFNEQAVFELTPGTFTDSPPLKTSEHRRNVGSFPGTHQTVLRAERKNRAVLGQHGQTWTLLQPRLLRFVFDLITARPHGEQTSSSNQAVNDGFGCEPSPSLSSTLFPPATGFTRKLFLSAYPLPSPF